MKKASDGERDDREDMEACVECPIGILDHCVIEVVLADRTDEFAEAEVRGVIGECEVSNNGRGPVPFAVGPADGDGDFGLPKILDKEAKDMLYRESLPCAPELEGLSVADELPLRG